MKNKLSPRSLIIFVRRKNGKCSTVFCSHQDSSKSEKDLKEAESVKLVENLLKIERET